MGPDRALTVTATTITLLAAAAIAVSPGPRRRWAARRDGLTLPGQRRGGRDGQHRPSGHRQNPARRGRRTAGRIRGARPGRCPTAGRGYNPGPSTRQSCRTPGPGPRGRGGATSMEAAGENAAAAAPCPSRVANRAAGEAARRNPPDAAANPSSPPDQDRLASDVVGEGAEHRLEDDFRAVVEGEQDPEGQQRAMPGAGVDAEVSRDRVGAERGGEPGRVQGPPGAAGPLGTGRAGRVWEARTRGARAAGAGGRGRGRGVLGSSGGRVGGGGSVVVMMGQGQQVLQVVGR